MQSFDRQILSFIAATLLQLLVAGGLASFSVIGRLGSERLFPRADRWARCASRMHRDGLNTAIVLVGLEAALIAWAARLVPPLCAVAAQRLPAAGAWVAAALPALAVLVQVAAATTGLALGLRRPVAAARLASLPLCPVYFLLRPLAGLFLRLVALVYPGLLRELAAPFEVIPAPDSPGEGFIEEDGSRLVRSIVAFGEKRVREVMVPRIDVFAVDSRMTIAEVRERIAESGHSRVPVYEGAIDRINGMLYTKDLVSVPEDEEHAVIGRLVREAYFVPEGKKIDDLLREFQLQKIHMAIVVDEYGGTAGIVTLEDILEEIVGEIRDEYDHESPLIRRTGEGSYAVEGRIALDDLREVIGVDLPSEEVDTLGGFLYHLLGRVPAEQEQLEYGGVSFRIERLEGQRIAEVRLTLPGSAEG